MGPTANSSISVRSRRCSLPWRRPGAYAPNSSVDRIEYYEIPVAFVEAFTAPVLSPALGDHPKADEIVGYVDGSFERLLTEHPERYRID